MLFGTNEPKIVLSFPEKKSFTPLSNQESGVKSNVSIPSAVVNGKPIEGSLLINKPPGTN